MSIYKKTITALVLAIGLNGVSYGQSNCTAGICEVNDLIVENGFTWTVSEAYSLGTDESIFSRGQGVVISNLDNRTIVFRSVEEGGYLNVLFTRPNGTIGYEQTKKAPKIEYDTLKGILTAPFIANATYEWFLDGAPIGTAGISRTFYANATGIFKVEVTWPSTSTSNSLKREEATTNTTSISREVKKVPVSTGISGNNESETLSIYPNPASESLRIQEKGSFQYTLLDTDAKVAASGNGNDEAKVSLEGLVPGIYFMEVSTPFKTQRKKVMVK